MSTYKEQDYMVAIDWAITTAYTEAGCPLLNVNDVESAREGNIRERILKRAWDLLTTECRFTRVLEKSKVHLEPNPDMCQQQSDVVIQPDNYGTERYWLRETSCRVSMKCGAEKAIRTIKFTPLIKKPADCSIEELTDEDKHEVFRAVKPEKETFDECVGLTTLKKEGYLVEVNSQEELVTIAGVLGTSKGSRTAWDTFRKVADFSCIKQHMQLHHIPDENRFINAAKKLFPNIDASYTGHTLTVLSRCIENIYANMGHPHAKHQQLAFYQFSKCGGTGKSLFLQRLLHFADTFRIMASNVQAPGKWATEEYAENYIGCISEYFPPSKYERNAVIPVINNVIDNLEYKVEHKGLDARNVHSNITLFIGTNNPVWDINDRRYGVIPYNEIDLSFRIKEEYREFLDVPEEVSYMYEQSTYNGTKDYWSYWDEVLRDLFESCPFGKTWQDKTILVSDHIRTLARYADTLHTIMGADKVSNLKYTPECATMTQFVKAYDQVVNHNGGSVFGYNDDSFRQVSNFVEKALTRAYQKGVIHPKRTSQNNKRYWYWDWTAIAALSEDRVDDMPDTEDNTDVNEANPLYLTRKAFESFLTSAEEHEESVVKLSDSWVFTPTNGVPLPSEAKLVNEGQEYVRINKLKEGAPITGDDSNYHAQNFLFEMDDINLDTQQGKMEDFIDKYKDCVLWYCFSGGKSMHMVLRTNLSDSVSTPELRKFILEKFSKTYFDGHLDMMNANTGRLGRNPGAVRHYKKDENKNPVYDKEGVVQEVMLINENAKAFDVCGWVNEYKYEQEKTKQRDSAVASAKKPFLGENTNDPIDQLRAMATSEKASEGIKLAYQILDTEDAPGNGESAKAVMTMCMLSAHNEIFEDLAKKCYSLCHEQHPTCVNRPYGYYMNRATAMSSKK